MFSMFPNELSCISIDYVFIFTTFKLIAPTSSHYRATYRAYNLINLTKFSDSTISSDRIFTPTSHTPQSNKPEDVTPKSNTVCGHTTNTHRRP